MSQLDIQRVFDLGMHHHKAGRLGEAEQLYRQILAQQPDHVDAIHFLGLIAHQSGRHDMAVELLRRAVALKPGYAQAYYNLGIVLADARRFDEAIAAYRHAIALNPNAAEAYSNLGNVLRETGRLEEAIIAHRRSIVLNPNASQAYSNLGIALSDSGQFDEAIAACRKAIALNPAHAAAYVNLSVALNGKGQVDEAMAACRQGIALGPSSPEAYISLGVILKATGRTDEAIGAYRSAIAINPKSAPAHSNLGLALRDKGQLDEAAAACRQAIVLSPHGDAYINLGLAMKDQGEIDQAIAAFRHAVSLKPNDAAVLSYIIYAANFHPDYDSHAIAEEHRRWDRQHAEPLRKFADGYANDLGAGRRLRIGYVSPHFIEHVVGRNLLPLLRRHDREQFEITCYADVSRADAMTREFQGAADAWRDIVGLSDEQVARRISLDRIDILVDLTLHMPNNRLPVFARKPAPIQVTFAGYPGSTGLTTIDYRLSDPYLDPPVMDESVYSERTIRLPHSFWCYDPLEDRAMPVNSLPALETGVFTFGCLGSFCKVNDKILGLWSQVMRRVEGSRLMLLAPPGSHRKLTVERLARDGIDPGRVSFSPLQSHRRYLELYHRIDLGLDSFPYSGHTTSLDSLWMGVPVVTLVGDRVVSRAGWSQTSNLGLTELAAHSGEQFVQVAVALAKNLPKLAGLRSTLRARMEQSPLMDAREFARDIEAAYRLMWKNWLEK